MFRLYRRMYQTNECTRQMKVLETTRPYWCWGRFMLAMVIKSQKQKDSINIFKLSPSFYHRHNVVTNITVAQLFWEAWIHSLVILMLPSSLSTSLFPLTKPWTKLWQLKIKIKLKLRIIKYFIFSNSFKENSSFDESMFF